MLWAQCCYNQLCYVLETYAVVGLVQLFCFVLFNIYTTTFLEADPSARIFQS